MGSPFVVLPSGIVMLGKPVDAAKLMSDESMNNASMQLSSNSLSRSYMAASRAFSASEYSGSEVPVYRPLIPIRAVYDTALPCAIADFHDKPSGYIVRSGL